MNLQQIKQAILGGKTVHWSTNNYIVMQDSKQQYNIACVSNGSMIGLTWLDGTTLNGKESEFYIKEG